jgi:hypothetical protein
VPDWREQKDLDRRFNFLFVSRITAIPTEVQTLQLPNGFLGRGVDRHAHIIYSVAVDASMYRPALAVSMLMELL